jgi:Protein of unknown function (DUF1604)
LGPKRVRFFLEYCFITHHVQIGWTPSTFISSRSDRAKQRAARPEDFMDEEDINELKERQGILDATDEMDLSGTAKLNRLQGADELESECVQTYNIHWLMTDMHTSIHPYPAPSPQHWKHRFSHHRKIPSAHSF